jgi:D-3-phosphoglycerate dehydrogenase
LVSVPPRTESESRLREYAGDPAEVARAVAGRDALIVHGAPVSAEVLGAAPLRLVCCARGGPVNVDVGAATERGIPVVNTPGKNAEAVAELTIAFALLLIRGVPRASRHLLDGGGFAESVFEGREVPSLTMGLVGLGHVGARWPGARGRSASPSSRTTRSRRAPRCRTSVWFRWTSCCGDPTWCPCTPRLTLENRRMFSRDQFARMRRGACFINTSRESLVDEEALRHALEQACSAWRRSTCWSGRQSTTSTRC